MMGILLNQKKQIATGLTIGLEALAEYKNILAAFDLCFGLFTTLIAVLAFVGVMIGQCSWLTFFLLAGFVVLNLSLSQLSNRMKSRFALEIFRMFVVDAILLFFTFAYCDGLFTDYWPGYLVMSFAGGTFFTATLKRKLVSYLQIFFWVGLLALANFWIAKSPLNWVNFAIVSGTISMSTAVLVEVAQVFNVSLDKEKLMKMQQDGDYYLTSLLIKPLMTHWNNSETVSAISYIEQKKKFTFKNRNSEIGGDICICGNLSFGDPGEKWIVFFNADAMGKSMQGAGGAIVIGTAMNNILSRYTDIGSIVDITPQDWIRATYKELDDIFKTFDGVMMASAMLGLISERTGKMFYFNAEHPWAVLYRDGIASFLEGELTLRKLGSPTELSFRILEAQLRPGDIIYIGSDGRDDISVSTDGVNWEMNSDETYFLRAVEAAGGDLNGVVRKLHGLGSLSDDLSLMRIGFQENFAQADQGVETAKNGSLKYSQALALWQNSEIVSAISLLKNALDSDPSCGDCAKLLAKIYYDNKEYGEAAHWLEYYLRMNPDSSNHSFLASICYRHIKDFKKAIERGETVRQTQPHKLSNLLNLADSYRVVGDFSKARSILDIAIASHPENPNVSKLDSVLKKSELREGNGRVKVFQEIVNS